MKYLNKNLFKKPFLWYKKLSVNGKLAGLLILILVITGGGATAFVLNSKDPKLNSDKIVNTPTQSQPLQTIKAKIELIEGQAFYKKPGQDWQLAKRGDQIQPDWRVKTNGAASRVIARFENQNEFRLDGNSRVLIENATPEKINIQAESGKIYSRINTEGKLYSVNSKDALYQADGTVFIVQATEDRQVLEVIDGSVTETVSNNIVRQGQRYIVEDKTNPTANNQTKKIDINDYKKDSFVEWNLKIDRANAQYKNSLGFLQDTTPPKIEIESPKNGAIIFTEPSSQTGAVQIKGRAEGAKNLQLINKSKPDQKTDLNLEENGSFTSPMIELPLGQSKLELVAEDQSGNKANQTLQITIQQKTTPENQSEMIFLESVQKITDKVEIKFSTNLPDDQSSKYKIVFDTEPNPEYGQSSAYLVLKNPGDGQPITRQIPISGNFDNPGKYYFRVCKYQPDSSSCQFYSNQKELDI